MNRGPYSVLSTQCSQPPPTRGPARSETRLRSQNRNVKSKIQNPKSKIQNPKSKISPPFFHSTRHFGKLFSVRFSRSGKSGKENRRNLEKSASRDLRGRWSSGFSLRRWTSPESLVTT